MTLQEAINTGSSFRNPGQTGQFYVPTKDSFILSGTVGPQITFSIADWARDDWETIDALPPDLSDIPAPTPAIKGSKTA